MEQILETGRKGPLEYGVKLHLRSLARIFLKIKGAQKRFFVVSYKIEELLPKIIE